MIRTTALGIGRGRGIEPCVVERSTEANAEPCKARPPQDITVKNVNFLQFGLWG